MRPKLKPWLAMGMIFVVGIVTGVALTVGLRSEWSRPPGAKQMQIHWQGRLNERLKLTPDQLARIDPILATAADQLRDSHREEMERISHVFESTDAKIAPLLTPEQQEIFKQMQTERQHDISRHMRRQEPPPDAPPPPPGH